MVVEGDAPGHGDTPRGKFDLKVMVRLYCNLEVPQQTGSGNCAGRLRVVKLGAPSAVKSHPPSLFW